MCGGFPCLKDSLREVLIVLRDNFDYIDSTRSGGLLHFDEDINRFEPNRSFFKSLANCSRRATHEKGPELGNVVAVFPHWAQKKQLQLDCTNHVSHELL